MTENLIASAAATIAASRARVWDALVNPASIKEYMFGAEVASDWTQGSPITWKGEWEGRPYEDKGEVLYVAPGEKLAYSHFSPLAGLPDKPENYHTVTITLDGDGDETRLSLTQDNNPTEEAREHSEKNWKTMLDGLKKFVEGNSQ
jgi:uncharacterized protein YndB with AHSA1/START domain